MTRQLLVIVFVLTLAVAGVGTWTWWYLGGAAKVVLSKEKQEAIWRAEHVTFEIETYFGSPFAAALREGDLAATKNLFADGFSASTIGQKSPAVRRHGTLVENKWTRQTETQLETDAEGLLDFFRVALSNFETVTNSRVRVLKIEKAEGTSDRFETELLVTARGFVPSGGRRQLSSHSFATFDLADDEIIRRGGALQSWKVEDLVVVDSERALMEEVTADFGLDRVDVPDNWDLPVSRVAINRFQCAVADYDQDEFLDIALATKTGRPFLLRSVEGREFESLSVQEIGIQPWQSVDESYSALVGWVDFDNDGFPDLLMGPRLYRNVGGLRFKDVTESSGLTFEEYPMGCTVVDYDCDGWLDLYVMYQGSTRERAENLPWVGDEIGGKFNRLWRNTGNGKFVDVTKQSGADGGKRASFASSWFFYDEDHFPDVYIANDFGLNVILRNRGDGTFEDVSIASGASGFSTSMGVATGDINNDGISDIYVANMYSKMGRRIIGQVGNADYPEGIYQQIKGSCAGNRLYTRTDLDSDFVDISVTAQVNEVGWAYAPLMSDFDEDGLLDLYATSGFMSFNRKKPDG